MAARRVMKLTVSLKASAGETVEISDFARALRKIASAMEKADRADAKISGGDLSFPVRYVASGSPETAYYEGSWKMKH